MQASPSAGRCRDRAWVLWPVLVAAVVATRYLQVTTPWLRQHDVEGHRYYIEHVITRWGLPPVLQGWETWQPPLYYVIAAVWRLALSSVPVGDPFRPVQYLSAFFYLATIVTAVWIAWRLALKPLEATSALTLLALLPAHVFFAGRINNDVLLPLVGAGVMLATAEFTRTGTRKCLWWLAFLLPIGLASKASSLAIVGGALALVLWAEGRSSSRWETLWRTYLVGLPALTWQFAWSLRTMLQTGDPLYVNAKLPDDLRVSLPAWRRLLSFDVQAFLGAALYYDEPVRRSYPTALLTSLIFGESGMHEYSFHCPSLLRLGSLGLPLLLAAGALIVPRAELRAVWLTSVVLVSCQGTLAIAYAVQFPFACNQDMRFYAQAYVPLACLCGLGIGHFWEGAGWVGRGLVCMLAATLLLGLADFYWALLF